MSRAQLYAELMPSHRSGAAVAAKPTKTGNPPVPVHSTSSMTKRHLRIAAVAASAW